jgi:hypothetical protein
VPALHEPAAGPAGRRRLNTLAAAGACVLVLLVAFAYMHTGPRAESLCASKGFPGPASFSVWPPGAECTGGTPEVSQTAFDPVFILPAVAVLMLGAGAVALRQPGR